MFSVIKNIYFHRLLTYFKENRPKLIEILPKDQMLEMSKSKDTAELIDINFVNSDLYDKMYSVIGKYKFEKFIKINFSEIDHKGVEFLANFEFKKLTNLNLAGRKYRKKSFINILKYCLGDIGIKQLRRCDLQKLVKLDLSNNKITDKGLELLAKCQFPMLSNLALNNNEFTAEGLKILGKCKFSKIISRLELNYNKICDEGIKILSQQEFISLRILYLQSNCITDISWEFAISMFDNTMKNLKFMYLEYNMIKDKIEFYEKVKKNFGRIFIY